MTDLPDHLPQRPAVADDAWAHDLLSEVLRSVRLTGAMLFLVEAGAPWLTQAPATRAFAPAVLPNVQHLISYHVVIEGSCWGGLRGQAPQSMQAGDILVVPQGDPYFLAAPSDAPQRYGDDEAVDFFRRMAAGELPHVVNADGGGAKTRFICGFLGCDAQPFNPVLASLPRVLHLRRAAAPGARLAHLVDFALGELGEQRAGRRDVLLRLAELLFVEVLRSHLAGETTGRHGWLAALRDPLLSRALAALHREPARAWTLDTLAAAAATSRSTLAERFVQVMDQPPMQYLAAWRMQLATRLLAKGRDKVRTVAEAVGYDSESAFSRAFKRHTGVPPSRWR